jgi:hypothetical protein
MNVLGPDDAAELYRMLHYGPVLVTAFAAVRISIDPSRDPPNSKETRTLESFVAYKASYGLVRNDADPATHFARFEAWRKSVGCDGPGDPRALPLHVFDAGSGDLDLGSRPGAERFQRRYGSPAKRLDGSGRAWEKGVAHGRDELEIAGRVLPVGLHWDVSAKRGSFKVANAREVWSVRRAGYVNVYPDAGIRGPSRVRRDLVRRVWPSSSRAQKMPLQEKGH